MSVISRVELNKALTLKTKKKKNQALNTLLLFALSIAEIHTVSVRAVGMLSEGCQCKLLVLIKKTQQNTTNNQLCVAAD